MNLLLRIILVLLFEVQGFSCLWTVSKITAKSGGFVTIPCHYHLIHKDHLKYWCRGRTWSTCMKMQPTEQKKKRPGISFHNSPDERVLTLTMTDLRSTDSNRYWCAVKIGGFLQKDIRTSLELTVTDGVPDLSVANNTVTGEEGGNVTVHCLYSEKLRDSEKKFCRSGDLHSCQTAEDVQASPDSTVQISDTNDGDFRVMLTGLKKTDAGWYWCMSGGTQAPVHINVNSVQQTTTSTRPFTSTMAAWTSYSSTNSFTVNPTNSSPTFSDAHNSKATLSPTTSGLPESTSDKTVRISTASPTTHSSTHPVTANSSSHCTGSVMTRLTSLSKTPYAGNSNSVTVSAKDPESTIISRDLWVIVLACGVLLLLIIVSGISWTLWSWQKTANTNEGTTDVTTQFHANDMDDLLNNEWTAASVVWINTGSDTVIIT